MQQKFKILIVDDEAVARQNIRKIVEQFCAEYVVVGEASSPLNGLKEINELKPDIVLLDIEMPGGTGFEMLDCLEHRTFAVIFITAYNQHAIKAFKYSAIDYLLKPVDIEELVSALAKATESRKEDFGQKQAVLKENFSQPTPKKLAIHTQSETMFVDIERIIRMEASGSYTMVYFDNGNKVLVSRVLKEFEQLLEEDSFFRTHNSHLINVQHVRKYVKKDGYSVLMSDNALIPIAIRRKEVFEEFVKRYTK